MDDGIIILPARFYIEYIKDIIGNIKFNYLIIYPILDIKNKNKMLSKAYVNSIFKMEEKYILFHNILNNCDELKSIGDLIPNDFEYKIVIVVNTKVDINFLKLVDELGLQEVIILIELNSKEDILNLINNSSLCVDFSDKQEISYYMIIAIVLGVPIICKPTELNYELFEYYPYYDEFEAMSLLLKKDDFGDVDRYEIIEKFFENDISEIF